MLAEIILLRLEITMRLAEERSARLRPRALFPCRAACR